MRPQAPRRLAAFDGLRALAALSVLGYHVGLASGYAFHGVFAPLVAELKAGVAVFFVISGCVLYLPWARAMRDGTPAPPWRSYARRRVVRIVPAFWVALTVFAISPLNTAGVSDHWWQYFGFLQVYSPRTVLAGLSVAWSLDVEVSFYLLLPLFTWMAMKIVRRWNDSRWSPRAQLVVFGALAGLGTAIRLAAAGSATAVVPTAGFALSATLAGFLVWFAVGMALAVLACQWEAGRSLAPGLHRLAQMPGRCWALSFMLFFAVAYLAPEDLFLSLAPLRDHLLIGLAAGALVLPAVAPSGVGEPKAILQSLGHPVVVWLGTISYGIYLWHLLVLQAIVGPDSGDPLHPLSLGRAVLLLVAVIFGAVVLGAASWYLVERPAQRLLNRGRRSPARPAALALVEQT